MSTLTLKRVIKKRKPRCGERERESLNGLVVTRERYVQIFQKGRRRRIIVCTSHGRRGIPIWKGEPL